MSKPGLSTFGPQGTVIHSIVIPLFAYIFTLSYNPFGISKVLDCGKDLFLFNATILYCILLVVVFISRLTLFGLRKRMEINSVQYSIHCIGEFLVMSAFCALYVCLMCKLDFFTSLVNCLWILLLIVIYPYSAITLSFALYESKHKNSSEDDMSIIRFRDDQMRLKLAVATSSLYYIEADENYVRISYMEKNGLKTYSLRSSMKRIEDVVSPFGIARCHRTYFVNPIHVRMISRSPEGMLFAELDDEAGTHIPISKTYHDKLASIL